MHCCRTPAQAKALPMHSVSPLYQLPGLVVYPDIVTLKIRKIIIRISRRIEEPSRKPRHHNSILAYDMPVAGIALCLSGLHSSRRVVYVEGRCRLPSETVPRHGHLYPGRFLRCQHTVVVVGDRCDSTCAVRSQPSGGVVTQRVCAALPDACPPVIYLSTRAKSERLIKGSGVT